jgi:carboxyl-terminal processing protease
LQESLKDDLVLEKALEVLGDPDLYRRTLSVPVELEAATKGTE